MRQQVRRRELERAPIAIAVELGIPYCIPQGTLHSHWREALHRSTVPKKRRIRNTSASVLFSPPHPPSPCLLRCISNNMQPVSVLYAKGKQQPGAASLLLLPRSAMPYKHQGSGHGLGIFGSMRASCRTPESLDLHRQVHAKPRIFRGYFSFQMTKYEEDVRTLN